MAEKNAAAVTAAEVQKRVDDAHEKGYEGETVDHTPREAYTVAGVTRK